MRLRSTLFLTLLTASLLTGAAVFAGNVLLPNDSFDKNNLPNLGLTPAEPETPPPESPKPVEVKQPDPAPVVVTASPTKPAIVQPSYMPPTAYTAAHPYQPPPPAPMPYSINIALEKVTWSANDLDTITSQLGLAKGNIANECHAGINGMIITDHGTYNVDSHMTTTTTVPYAGAITNAMLSVYAVCDSAPNPGKYNYIQKMGTKFGISVGSAFCQPKSPVAGTMRHITLTHTANGSDKCAYQP